MIEITVFEQKQQVVKGTTLYELSKKYQSERGEYVLAYRNGELCELYKTAKQGDRITFLATDTNNGMLAYKRSMTLLMLKAFHDVCGESNEKVMVKHSFGAAYFCTIQGKSQEEIKQLLPAVEQQMRMLVQKNIPIKKVTIHTNDALKRFQTYEMEDKVKLFRYRRGSRTNLYAIERYEDYFYGYMVPTTGCLKYFALEAYNNGFLLKMPTKERPEQVADVVERPKLFQILKEADEWGKTLEIDTVGALNDAIVAGRMNEIILIQEALQEKKIAQLADEIVKHQKKIVLIAGPSSSGKTTFSHRLAIQLKIHGMRPHPISIDNYFKNREDTPKDENGEYNFEVLEAIDILTFQQNMNDLLQGIEVALPSFNFVSGKREYRGNTLCLTDKDILVIEGIHGLNQKLTGHLSSEAIYKIYISALTQLNVDEHNRVPTTDGRLLRRLVRDAQYRGTSAKDTIGRWNSVRQGEESFIFPYQEEADAMFNSALIYELAVLKQYAEPLLYAVPLNCEEYQEAKRLLKFLDYFLGISGDSIPHNSLIREFIGGNCFHI